jgi:hypothetical protein
MDKHLNMENVKMLKTITYYLCRIRTFCCPETSLGNYHHTLRNSPEERSSLYGLVHTSYLAIQTEVRFNSRFRLVVDQLQSDRFYKALELTGQHTVRRQGSAEFGD